MKLKPQQMRQRLAMPDDATRLYLLHGPDEAGAAEMAGVLASAMGEAAERVDLDAAALRGNPGLLADEAASLSLFGDRRHIRIYPIGEESVEAVTLLLAAERAGNPVVAIAPSIKTTGKLAKLVEGATNAAACACYMPEGRDAQRMVSAMAQEAGLRLAPGLAERLLASAGGDRAIVAREVEKLALYLDARPEAPVDADPAAIDAIGAAIEESVLFDAIAAVVEGRPDALGSELSGIVADNAAVPLLRQLVRRLIALAEMRREIDTGDAIDAVLKRHRVFWKEEAATKQALRRWSPAQLSRAIDRLRLAERAIMAPGNAGPLLAAHETLTIARAAARLG
ncbi:DNA polymerase III subunit delta [Sphingomonas sp.]